MASWLAGWAWLALATALFGCAMATREMLGRVDVDEVSLGEPPAAASSVELAALVGADEDDLRGEATWYGRRHHGRTTASGEPFDMHAYTAAHKTLPFGTWVRVTRVDTRQSVVVRINDRGPYGRGRVIDLSRAAAEQIDLIRPGHRPVILEVLALP